MENFGNFMPPETFNQQMLEDLEGKASGKKGKIVAIVIGLLIVAAVAGLGIWYWANHNNAAETAQGGESEGDNASNMVGSIGEGKVDYPENPNAEDEGSDEEEAKDDDKDASSAEDNDTTTAEPTQPTQPTQPVPVKKETVTINLEANGATISATKVTCEKSGSDCKVKLPTITRDGWEVLGWGENQDARTAKYQSGAEISVGGNKTLYAVTKKTNTFTFEKRGAQEIGASSISCDVYNSQKTCAIKMPTIKRDGWEILGWSQDAKVTTAQFKVGDTIYTSNSRTLYAVTKSR